MPAASSASATDVRTTYGMGPGILTHAPARRRASAGDLRRAPRRGEAPLELRAELRDRDARLLERVAVAQRDGVVLERLVVDRDAPRRPDLVLAPVALADRAAGVELGRHPLPQVLVDPARELRLTVLVDERQHGDLDRREP